MALRKQNADEWFSAAGGRQPRGDESNSCPGKHSYLGEPARQDLDLSPLPADFIRAHSLPQYHRAGNRKVGSLGNLMIGSLPRSACWTGERAFGRSRTSEVGPLPCPALRRETMKGIGDLRDRGCHEKEASKARTPHLRTYQAAVPQAAKAFCHCPNLPTIPLPALALSAVLFVGLLLKKSLPCASRMLARKCVDVYA